MKELIANQLENLGVKKGDCLLVHSSFKSLGKGITANDVIEGLITAVGEKGTLILPALSYSNVTEESPFFDIKNTPACIGYLPNFFLSREGQSAQCTPPTPAQLTVIWQGSLQKTIILTALRWAKTPRFTY